LIVDREVRKSAVLREMEAATRARLSTTLREGGLSEAVIEVVCR
jgi:hypothetical protein